MKIRLTTHGGHRSVEVDTPREALELIAAGTYVPEHDQQVEALIGLELQRVIDENLAEVRKVGALGRMLMGYKP